MLFTTYYEKDNWGIDTGLHFYQICEICWASLNGRAVQHWATQSLQRG